MAKFHINKKGVPAPCRAKKGNCPFGGEDSHYATIEKAQIATNMKNEKEHGILPNTKNEEENYNAQFNNITNDLRNATSVEQQEDLRTKLAELSLANQGHDKAKMLMSEIFKNIKSPDGGATISISGKYEVTIPTTGFCASPYPQYSKVFDNVEDISFENMLTFMKNVGKDDGSIFKEKDTYIGLWNDPESGKVYLDISKRYHTAKEARVACEDNDQIAYFDLQLFESVDVDRNATSGQNLV